MANFLTKHFNFLSNPVKDVEIETAYASATQRVAFKEVALFIATSYIANSLSKCEFKVYEGGREVKNELYYLLNVSPNPNQSGSQMVNYAMDRLCYKGESLLIPHKGNQLYVADSFIPEKHPMKEHTFNGVVVDDQMLGRKYKASEVYYFQLNNRNVKAIIDSLYQDYGTLIGSAIDGFRATRGRKYKLVLDSTKVGDKQFAEDYEKVVKKQLEAFMENPNAIYPQYRGYDLQEMKHETAGDSGDIIAMRKEIFDTVAQAFKIPNSMMYGNMTNASDVVNQFLTFAVDPIAVMISDELTRKSFTFPEWRNGSKVVVDTKRINHVDIFNVANGVEKLIGSGAFSIDDVLLELGYPTLNTEFSKAHFVTKNFSLAEDALKQLSTEGGEK